MEQWMNNIFKAKQMLIKKLKKIANLEQVQEVYLQVWNNFLSTG